MTNLEKVFLTKIENTSNYGLIKESTTFYDDQRILAEYLLNFRIYKIRCWTEKSVGLSGIQIFYKDRITSKDVKTIDVLKKDFAGEEDEIILDTSEMINEITIWKDEALSGFEIKTNKNRRKQFGWCGEGIKIKLDEFENGNNYLVGFFLGFHKKDGIQSMGFYYINEKNFYLLLNLGIFMLRIKLKREEFKNKIKDKLSTLEISDKALYLACCLPDNQFFGIFKYIFT